MKNEKVKHASEIEKMRGDQMKEIETLKASHKGEVDKLAALIGKELSAEELKENQI